MELLDSFHFARPWALILIPVLLLQVVWYLKFRHTANPWLGKMRSDLQAKLLQAPKEESSYMPWIILSIILLIFALAGPSWSQQSRPVFSKQDALVIVLDMSLSMLAEDVKPNRVQRSKLKLMDLLEQRREGLTGLVVYAGDAYTVTPLTSDTATIRNLLPALEPALMPKLGSAAEAGIEQAQQLMRQAGIQKGRILLVTDGLDETALKGVSKQLNKDVQLSILAVGTAEGAPIPLGDQGFVKDNKGSVIISQLDMTPLQNLQEQTSARLSHMQLDNSDLDYLLAEVAINAELKEEEAQLPLWIEQGHWFLLPVLPLAALAFRRGWLMVLPLLFLLGTPKPSYAFWLSEQEQAQIEGEQAFKQQDYGKASQLMNNPAWQGSAYYRDGQYDKAAEAYNQDNSANGHYNRGNALAQQGQYQQALNAYDQALQKSPELSDAQHNRELIEKLLQEQQKQQQDQSQNGEQDQQQNGQQDQQNASQQDSAQSQSQQEQSQNADQQQDASEQNQAQPSQAKQNQSQQNQQSRAEQDAQAQQDRQQNSTNDQSSQAQTEQGSKDSQDQDQGQETQSNTQLSEAKSEEDHSLEQWLRRVPDDPAGLLRRKFEYQSSLRNQRLPEGREAW